MLVREFFDFIVSRESIRINREEYKLPRDEWTKDPILKEYKFTNVKRKHDRTTRELMEQFYAGHEDVSPSVRLLNCTMARFFGHVETVVELGWQDSWDREALKTKIEARIARGEKIFTGAYIIPNCGRSDPKHIVVLDVLRDVHSWAHSRDTDAFHPELTLKKLITDLCAAVDGMGSFMAKEVLLDFILSSGWTPPDWQIWTPVGPGARRGAARVLSTDGSLGSPLSEAKALTVVKDLYDAYRQVPLPGVQPLWPDHWESLDLCDIQFQLCEFDKYMRAKLGEGRPKAKFVPKT